MRKSKTKSKAMAKADKYFSKYIRLRDSRNGIAQCITCNTIKDWKEMDCGHFISRRFQATRYDEKNANSQCKKCNRFQNGNQFQHGKRIDEKYGDGTADALLLKSKQACHRKQFDFEFIADEYRQKVKDI